MFFTYGLRAKTAGFIKIATVAAMVIAAQVTKADTLMDIKARGSLICATLGTVPPLSFQDPNTRATVGYDVDICNMIAKSLNVKTEIKLVSAAGRIPELAQSRVDVVAGSFGWTADRAKQVDYSYVYNTTAVVVAVRASAGIKELDQLKGKRIASQSASTSAAAAREKLPNSTIVTFEDTPQTILAFRQGKADGLALNPISMAKFVNEVRGTPDEVHLLDQSPLFIERQGVGVKKGEAALLAAVNAALIQADKSGELTKTFDKWMGIDTEFKLKRNFAVAEIKP